MAKKLFYERQTIRAMVQMYCQGQRHSCVAGGCCGSCVDLLNYAYERLERCVFQECKPVCSQCPIQCYRPEQRVQITAVMRYSGPRMLLRHPLIAIRHLVNERKVPNKNVQKYLERKQRTKDKTLLSGSAGSAC